MTIATYSEPTFWLFVLASACIGALCTYADPLRRLCGPWEPAGQWPIPGLAISYLIVALDMLPGRWDVAIETGAGLMAAYLGGSFVGLLVRHMGRQFRRDASNMPPP